jgi:hypothetical protein
MGKIKKANKILVRGPEGKKSLRRYRRRWEDNMEMHLKETGCENVD